MQSAARAAEKSWATPLREGDRGAAVPRSDQAMRGGVAAVEDRTQGGYGVVMVGGLAQDLAPAARVRARPRTMHGKPGLSRRRQRESRDSRLRNHAGTPRSAPPGRRPLARAGRTYRLFELDDPSLPAPIIAPSWSKHRTLKPCADLAPSHGRLIRPVIDTPLTRAGRHRGEWPSFHALRRTGAMPLTGAASRRHAETPTATPPMTQKT